MQRSSLARRQLIRLLGLGGITGLVTACAAAPPATAPAKPTEAPKPAAQAQPAASPAASPSPSPAAAPPVVKPVPAAMFNPFGSNFEMRWEQMAGKGATTPAENFFVRNHTKTPAIDARTWKLRIEGSGVESTTEISYDDLMKMPSVTVQRYLECAGNGRSFFETIGGQKADGTQWKLGAVGVADWTGVPLKAILERAKVKSTAREVMPEGLDDLKVRRPFAIAKAMEDDTLVVHTMNGQPLPPDHGFPARILAPGWIGIASVKWLGRIEVSETPLFSAWNTDSYVLVGPAFKPEGQSKGPILSGQNVKSALELAWPAQISAGKTTIRGRAWSPDAKIAKVEYSLDGGKTFQAAKLGDQNTARSWVRFEFEWEAKSGPATIMTKATDEKGNTQPDKIQFNQQGYLYNGLVNHPVTVA
jgi:DMSO/TMAO reductase YedYZ molybdopterin-dependent catalytic subunit